MEINWYYEIFSSNMNSDKWSDYWVILGCVVQYSYAKLKSCQNCIHVMNRNLVLAKCHSSVLINVINTNFISLACNFMGEGALTVLFATVPPVSGFIVNVC